MTKEKYLDLFNKGFKNYSEIAHGGNSSIVEKRSWISNDIFNNTFYDDGIDNLFMTEALKVLKAINKNSLSIFPKPGEEEATLESEYTWGLMVLQNPFFMENIDWGTSIRCAWWDHKDDFKIEITHADEKPLGFYISVGSFKEKVDTEGWKVFIEALIEFCETE